MFSDENRLLSLTSSLANQCTNPVKLHCQTAPVLVENGTVSTNGMSSLQIDSTMNIDLPVAIPTDKPMTSIMAETTSAKVGPDADSKFTRNTKLWWQEKTGWTDDTYYYRRNAIYNRIREKWPEEKLLNGRDGNGALVKQEIRDWLRPSIISFNDQNWPPGAIKDRFERQLQPYISWALYLNRHPPTVNVPTISTSADATSEISTVTATPTLPSYSFVTPNQFISSTPRSRDPMDTVQGDYWSQTSSDENEPASAKTPYQSRKSQSVLTQSPSTIGFDWDDIELVIDARGLSQDHIWIPMYDLKPVPKHSRAHWADFRMVDLYHKISSELHADIEQDRYQFVFQNQPGNFAFRREGAYRIVLKRFSQMTPTDQVLRLRLEKVSVSGSPAASLPTPAGQQTPVHTPYRSPALAKRPSNTTQPKARPILTSDVQLSNANGVQLSNGVARPYEWAAQRPRKRIKLPVDNPEPSPSLSGEVTDSETTPPSGNSFTAVNNPAVPNPVTTAPAPIEEPPNILEQPQQEEDARNVMFSESEGSDHEMTQPDDHERTSSDIIALVKMEGAG